MNTTQKLEDFLEDVQFLELNGTKTELLTTGEGSPLLYLHGMDGIEGSAAIISQLSQTFKVYAPSHPGFGASDLPRDFSTIDDLSYFYLDLAQHLDLQHATLAGFSIGGWLAAEILTKDSSRFANAILGAPLGLRTADKQEQIVTDIFMLDRNEAEARMQVSPPVLRDVSDMSQTELERMARNAEAVALYGWSPYLYNPKLEQRLHRIDVPTLVLWGEDDRIAPTQYSNGFVSNIAGARLETIPSCGHRIYTDSPESAAEHIANFKKTAAR